MRSLIVTGATENMFPVLDLTLESKQKYARRHGYDFLVKRCWKGVAKYHLAQYEETMFRHILGFLRVLVCFEQLKDYDAVMWLDGDSVVTNSDITMEEITGHSDSCFYVSMDWAVGVQTFSTGNFIVKRHAKTQELYEQFLETSKKIIGNEMQEQITLNIIHSSYPHLRDCFQIVHRKYLQSVPQVQEKTATWRGRPAIQEPWNPDCFIAHLTGITQQERIQILTNGSLTYK